MVQGGGDAGLAPEQLPPLGILGKLPWQELEGDESIKAQLPGLVDEAHAPAPEEGLHVIARYLRRVGARMPANGGIGARAGVGPRRGKQRMELRLNGAHLPPAPADLGKQLGASGADLLRS